MYYKNSLGKKVTVRDVYYADIVSDITAAGKKVISDFRAGWFKTSVRYPAAAFYLLGSPVTDYFANKPRAVRFTYYFEVRAKTQKDLDDTSKALCSELSEIYFARRSQYDDSFDEDIYIKRITFTFTVKIGE